MLAAVILVIMLLAIVVPTAFLAYQTSKMKADLHCISIHSDALFEEVRFLLQNERIFCTVFDRQEHTVIADPHPIELWIRKSDYEKVLPVIQARYVTEVIPTTIIVKARLKSKSEGI